MIILYNPPSSANKKPIVPMSLLALGALLENKHDYMIIDGNLVDDPLIEITRAVRETSAIVLGVTVMPGPQLMNAVAVCSQVKQQFPELLIVWGGYFPTQHYDVALQADYVDYVVRGHGETVFLALMDSLAKGQIPVAMQGLAYQDATGQIIDSTPAPIPHPDQLPDYPYHRIDLTRYIRPTFMGKRTLPHHSSYGCPFFCNFCAVVNMVNGRWLAQSAEHTASVVRGLVEHWNIDAIEFYDNNFFTNEARVAAFSEQIMNLGIGWWGEGRIDTMLNYSDRTWKLMQDSGLRMVFLGAESGSNETLKRMDKGGRASTEKTLEIAQKMAQYHIVPEMSFVIGNPPDPQGDLVQTFEFIRKVKRVNPKTEIIIYVYTPVPLSGELYEQARADGFEFPGRLEDWVSDDWQDFVQRRSANTPWMSDPLRKQIHNFERVLNAYYPTATNFQLNKFWRGMLKTASSWRYHTRFYRYPIELRVMQKLLRYQRPETTGF